MCTLFLPATGPRLNSRSTLRLPTHYPITAWTHFLQNNSKTMLQSMGCQCEKALSQVSPFEPSDSGDIASHAKNRDATPPRARYLGIHPRSYCLIPLSTLLEFALSLSQIGMIATTPLRRRWPNAQAQALAATMVQIYISTAL